MGGPVRFDFRGGDGRCHAATARQEVNAGLSLIARPLLSVRAAENHGPAALVGVDERVDPY